ncbi:MAG: hypothetical protein ACKVJ2_08560 [Pseudomonadales bacterium]|jgi:epoxyqueuosine reductase|tara:strand:+ start:298 stop:459 length:162 start_codon:yes stop_codon:yes gene_type:complete
MTNVTLEEQLHANGLKLLSVIQYDAAEPGVAQKGSILAAGECLVLIGNSSEGM